jgi:hypothetical protein
MSCTAREAPIAPRFAAKKMFPTASPPEVTSRRTRPSTHLGEVGLQSRARSPAVSESFEGRVPDDPLAPGPLADRARSVVEVLAGTAPRSYSKPRSSVSSGSVSQGHESRNWAGLIGARDIGARSPVPQCEEEDVTQDGSLANREWLFPSQSGYEAPALSRSGRAPVGGPPHGSCRDRHGPAGALVRRSGPGRVTLVVQG